MTREEFIGIFRDFRDAPDEVINALLDGTARKSIPRETVIYRPGADCPSIAFVLSGLVRVYSVSESGREITLYEILPGETCILNASCLLSTSRYPAHAEAVTDVDALMIPAALFTGLVDREPAMRKYVLTLFSARLSAIMELVEEVTFGRLDRRLEEYLVEKSQDGILRTTHQAVANDLGTSREVVSRLLKDMERHGKVRLSRSEIAILSL